jgi:hypothetical protein
MAPNISRRTLKGHAGWVDYLVGYLTRMKQHNADDFISMAETRASTAAAAVLAGLRRRHPSP